MTEGPYSSFRDLLAVADDLRPAADYTFRAGSTTIRLRFRSLDAAQRARIEWGGYVAAVRRVRAIDPSITLDADARDEAAMARLAIQLAVTEPPMSEARADELLTAWGEEAFYALARHILHYGAAAYRVYFSDAAAELAPPVIDPPPPPFVATPDGTAHDAGVSLGVGSEPE